MKVGTMDLLKFKRLVRRLKESNRGVVGLLEMLWAGVAKNCPRGDIGRFCNEDIAVMVDWDGDADDLVAALVECRWLDEDDECRLVVHDWADHCPNYLKANINRLGGFFGRCSDVSTVSTVEPETHPKTPSKTHPETGPMGGAMGESSRAQILPSLSLPIQVYPSPTTPTPTNPSQGELVERWVGAVDDEDFLRRVKEEANRFARLQKPLDRDLVWRACWVAVEFDSREVVADCCDKIRNGDARNPISYLNGAMREVCKRSGQDWEVLKKLVPPTPPPKPLAVIHG
jgi:hypothetical protein